MDEEMSLEWRAYVKIEGKSFSSVSGELFLILKCFLVGTRSSWLSVPLAALPISG